jgi:hypothetical protein
MVRRIVLGEPVASEIAVELAQDRVHVVGAGRGVVELDQERGALHAVVARFAREQAARPREVDRIAARGVDRGAVLGATASTKFA